MHLVEISPQKSFGFALFGMSMMSAFLVNDTLALMATPIMLSVAKQLRIRPGVFLITLALGVTIGSKMTAIGNPQNLPVAVSTAIPNPIMDFLYYPAAPTLHRSGGTYRITVYA